jgi:hypothetical protein
VVQRPPWAPSGYATPKGTSRLGGFPSDRKGKAEHETYEAWGVPGKGGPGSSKGESYYEDDSDIGSVSPAWRKGKGGGKGGKGKGKGKGKDGSSGSSGTDTEGKTRKDIPEEHRCCIHHFWGLCPTKPGEPYTYFLHKWPAPYGICEHVLFAKYVKDRM